MATLTLRLPEALSTESAAAASARPGFWRRAFEAAFKARSRAAALEVSRYRDLDPSDRLVDGGFGVRLRDVGVLPFVR